MPLEPIEIGSESDSRASTSAVSPGMGCRFMQKTTRLHVVKDAPPTTRVVIPSKLGLGPCDHAFGEKADLKRKAAAEAPPEKRARRHRSGHAG
jgi:hypothetical protein